MVVDDMVKFSVMRVFRSNWMGCRDLGLFEVVVVVTG